MRYLAISLIAGYLAASLGLWAGPSLAASPTTAWTVADGVLEGCVEESVPPCITPAGRTLHLAPSPQDCGTPDGSRTCPFVSRADALAALEPGDTLLFMNGTHDLSGGFTIERLHGRACAPIVLRAEPKAVFSAEIATRWQPASIGPNGLPIPKGVELFESLLPDDTLPVGGLFWDSKSLGHPVALPRYRRAKDLISITERYTPVEVQFPFCSRGNWTMRTRTYHDGRLGLYTGPGFFLDEREGQARVLLRLQPNTTTRQQGLDFSSDPLEERLHLFTSNSQVLLRRSSHLIFENWRIHFARGLRIDFGAHHIDFHGLEAVAQPYNSGVLQIRSFAEGQETVPCDSRSCHEWVPDLCPSPDACACNPETDDRPAVCHKVNPPHHLRVRHASFQGGFPPWLFWTDIKWRSAVPDPEGICGGWNFQVDNDRTSCSCETLEGIPSNPAIRVEHVTDNPGYRGQHGPMVLVSSSVPAPPDQPGPPYCVSVTNSTVADAWQGIVLADGSRLRVTGNQLHRTHDEAFQIRNTLDLVEVAHNTSHDTLTAFASAGVADHQDTGDVFIHHNVIDNSEDGPPARNRIACIRPGAEARRPEWNHHDVDGDGRNDGFCTGLMLGGHGVWGTRWNLYSNTLLADNAMSGGALSSVKQSAGNPEPAHFLGNILVQGEPGRPLYTGLRYDRFSDGNACREPLLGLQVTDGNLYWREGDSVVSSVCPSLGECCDRLDRLPSLPPLFQDLESSFGPRNYPSLPHFQCGVSDQGEADLAALSACGHTLGCRGCRPGQNPGVNEGRSLFRDPHIVRSQGYRPSRSFGARIQIPDDWPDSDWPWIGARPPLFDEVCKAIDHRALKVVPTDGRFLLKSASGWQRVFDRRDDADSVRDLLRFYHADQMCSVDGGSQTGLPYLLSNHQALRDTMPGEDCEPLHVEAMRVRRQGDRFALDDEAHFLFDDGNQASLALKTLLMHHFTQSCTLASGDESPFHYVRR